MKLPEDGCNAVQEIGGEVEHDGELGELLEQLPRGEGRVVRGPAADQEKPAAPLKKERLKQREVNINHIFGGLATALRIKPVSR